MVKLVIVAPYYEEVTQLWNPFLKGWVKSELEKRGAQVILLWADDANKEKLFEAVKDPDVHGVLGAAHGWERGIVGQYNQVLIQVGDQIGPEWKKICLNMVSCLVAQELIPWLVEQGVPSAVGEVTEYAFTSDGSPRDGNDPEEDQLLKYYLRAEYTFWFRMAEGYTAGQAYKQMLEEYEIQAREAEKVDEETAYWLRYDASNRKFFGDPNFVLPVPGVKTQIQLNITTIRDPRKRKDNITVAGKVVALDGSVPKGSVEIWVNDLGTVVNLDDQGGFTYTFTINWLKNEETLYHISVNYPGWSNNVRYLPTYIDTEVSVKPVTLPTKLTIEDIETKRDGPLVYFNIKGKLVDKDGVPVPGQKINVYVGNGELYETDAETNENGEFNVSIEKSYPVLQTKATVVARFSGDDVYQSSEDIETANFPPNWDVIKTLLAAVAMVATVIAIILASL